MRLEYEECVEWNRFIISENKRISQHNRTCPDGEELSFLEPKDTSFVDVFLPVIRQVQDALHMDTRLFGY